MNIIKTTDITSTANLTTIDSFTLKDRLGISENTDHSKWVKRAINRARLVEGEDFIVTTFGDIKTTAQLGGSSKTNDNTKVYHFTLDAVEMIGMLTDSDVGHAIRKEMQNYKRAYLTGVESKLLSQSNIIKTLATDCSLSNLAKSSGYRVAKDIIDSLGLATGTKAVKRIADYNQVPTIEIGTHTYYSVVHFVEAYRKFVSESELNTIHCKVTYRHILTNLIYTHKHQ